MFKKDGRSESGITLVATNCELVGDVHFSDQLLVNGVVKGNIYAQAGSRATVTVSEKGQVRGEIRVPNVIVNGKVTGDIRSDKHIELAADWILRNRFATDHSDPNLAGAVINTRLRHRRGKLWYTQRDIGSSFGVRFLSSYHDHHFGEKVAFDVTQLK